MLDLTVWQWILGVICAYFVGVAKTGVPGLGIFVVPLMVFTVGDARQASGWLLPILCMADLFAVIYWRRHAAVGRLFALTPWVLIGMASGAWALRLNERTLRPLIASIVLTMLLVHVWRKIRKTEMVFRGSSLVYGGAAGFATTVANAAGPIMNLYLLSKNLPKTEFIATGAWFFFVINLSKVPIYLWQGMIGPRSLLFNLMLAPVVLLGALTGRWLFDRMNQKLFEALVLVITAISAAMLFR